MSEKFINFQSAFLFAVSNPPTTTLSFSLSLSRSQKCSRTTCITGLSVGETFPFSVLVSTPSSTCRPRDCFYFFFFQPFVYHKVKYQIKKNLLTHQMYTGTGSLVNLCYTELFFVYFVVEMLPFNH